MALACTTALVAIAAAAVLHRRRQRTLAMLAAYAEARAYRFVAGAPAPRVEGGEGGIPFAIDLVRLEGRVNTRVTARAPRGRCPRLRLVPGRATPRLRSEHPDLLREPLARREDALRTLRARDGVWIASDGARVVCAWPGLEDDPRLLDAARLLVTTLADTHVPDVPYR